MPQNRQQRFAQIAYQKVHRIASVEKENKEFVEGYGRLCLQFPAMLHGSGLCQAISFFQSKAGKPDSGKVYQQFLADIAEALGIDAKFAEVRECDAYRYQELTRLARYAADSFKRYAEALLKIESTDAVK